MSNYTELHLITTVETYNLLLDDELYEIKVKSHNDMLFPDQHHNSFYQESITVYHKNNPITDHLSIHNIISTFLKERRAYFDYTEEEVTS